MRHVIVCLPILLGLSACTTFSEIEEAPQRENLEQTQQQEETEAEEEYEEVAKTETYAASKPTSSENEQAETNATLQRDNDQPVRSQTNSAQSTENQEKSGDDIPVMNPAESYSLPTEKPTSRTTQPSDKVNDEESQSQQTDEKEEQSKTSPATQTQQPEEIINNSALNYSLPTEKPKTKGTGGQEEDESESVLSSNKKPTQKHSKQEQELEKHQPLLGGSTDAPHKEKTVDYLGMDNEVEQHDHEGNETHDHIRNDHYYQNGDVLVKPKKKVQWNLQRPPSS